MNQPHRRADHPAALTPDPDPEPPRSQPDNLDAMGGLVHDFNNMLSVIDGNARLLRRVVPPADRPRLDDMLAAVRHASGLTSRLFRFLEPHLNPPAPAPAAAPPPPPASLAAPSAAHPPLPPGTTTPQNP